MDLQHVKLSNLCIGPEIDSRGGKAPVDDLIESIKARGLIQPLAVRATGEEDEYEIIAGHRRYEALRIIHGKKDPAVPCVVLAPGDDAEALELSTMENVLRKPLHPVEEYDAYARLVAQGVTVFEIAKRFGKTERWVRQRLQLGRLSPLLRDAWRKGEISTEQAAAFSCSADHARQESVWAIIQKAYGDYTKRPDAIRSELEDEGYGSDDARVAIIGGIEAYKAAGGRLTDDLFKRPGTGVAKDLQFYPTPRAVIETVLDEIGLGPTKDRWNDTSPSKLVLEPSCGDGRIMDVIRERGHRAIGVEVHQGRAEAAKAKGHPVMVRNFLETAPEPKFDFVVLNPPFYGKHWQKHLEHARKFVKPDGVVACILPASAHYDGGKLDGTWHDLPVASFSESGTNIPTGYLVWRA